METPSNLLTPTLFVDRVSKRLGEVGKGLTDPSTLKVVPRWFHLIPCTVRIYIYMHGHWWLSNSYSYACFRDCISKPTMYYVICCKSAVLEVQQWWSNQVQWSNTLTCGCLVCMLLWDLIPLSVTSFAKITACGMFKWVKDPTSSLYWAHLPYPIECFCYRDYCCNHVMLTSLWLRIITPVSDSLISPPDHSLGFNPRIWEHSSVWPKALVSHPGY